MEPEVSRSSWPDKTPLVDEDRTGTAVNPGAKLEQSLWSPDALLMAHGALWLNAEFCSPPWAISPSHCTTSPTSTRLVWLVGALRLRSPWRCGGIHLTLYASRAASPAGPLGKHTGKTLSLILALSLSFSRATSESAPKRKSGCTKMSETCRGRRREGTKNGYG